MSLHPEPIGEVPEETARVARLAFPKGNRLMAVRDKLGPIFADAQFAALFARRGQPAEAPWRLALVCLLQYAEGLSDRQAADAVRARLDWKYLLGLQLSDAGFDFSVLSEFRARLVEGNAEALLFERLLACLDEHGLLKRRGRQRTDSTHVLAAVRSLSWLECVLETMHQALEALAVAAPEWVQEWVLAKAPEWPERYGLPVSSWRLPKQAAARIELAEQVGREGMQLMQWAHDPASPSWLRQLPALETLRQIWVQQYKVEDGQVRWRSEKEKPPWSLLIASPHDPEARLGTKRTTEWVGYKVHLTETCESASPHLITDVHTAAAPRADIEALAPIHQRLHARQFLPKEHLVDAGYISAEAILDSGEQGIHLLGPVLPDPGWQAREGGYDAGQFDIDWSQRTARCPQGRSSIKWKQTQDRHGTPVVEISFHPSECQACTARTVCTRAEKGGRTLTVRLQASHECLQQRRKEQLTSQFWDSYAARAGCEGTISRAVRSSGLRRSRYIGEAKTHLDHLLTAAAINLLRTAEWLMGKEPWQRRRSRLNRLAAVA